MVGERLDAPQEDDETEEEEEELLEARPTKEGYTATVRGTRRSSTYNHHQFLSFSLMKNVAPRYASTCSLRIAYIWTNFS